MEKQPIKIAVFDLNQTLYLKSSKEEFFKFICKKEPHKLLNIFRMGLYALGKEWRLISKTTFKENFFRYLDKLPPDQLESLAREFWTAEWPEHFNKKLLERISVLREEGICVVFVTGTLDAYVKPLFETLLVPDHWIATHTQYSKGSYKIIGKACKDQEKIRQLNRLFHPRPYELVEAYSDKKEPVLKAARKGFLLEGDRVLEL